MLCCTFLVVISFLPRDISRGLLALFFWTRQASNTALSLTLMVQKHPLIAFCESNFRKLQTLELHTSLSWPFHPWRARAQHDYFGHRGLRGSSRPFINKIFEDAIVTYRSDHDSLCAEFQIHYEGNVYVRNAPTETDSRSFYILQQQ